MTDSFYGVDVPPQLHDLTERHRQHLAELITMLHTAGMDEASIEEAVDQLIANYRVQLIEAVRALGASLE